MVAMYNERPHFFQAAMSASQGRIVPVPGGVLIRDEAGNVIGAVGASGDTSDKDEVFIFLCARALFNIVAGLIV